jgi:hypothetical protein
VATLGFQDHRHPVVKFCAQFVGHRRDNRETAHPLARRHDEPRAVFRQQTETGQEVRGSAPSSPAWLSAWIISSSTSDEVVLKIAGVKHWLWRAVDQTGIVLDVLVQRRRDKRAAKRLLRKLLKKQMRPPRVMITDRLALRRQKGRSCPASSIASTRH